MNYPGFVIKKERLEKTGARKDFVKEFAPFHIFRKSSRERRKLRKKF